MGWNNSAATLTDGGVLGWGATFGCDAGPFCPNDTTPTPVSGFSTGVQQVALGLTHSCAVTSVGGAVCWGENGAGQLGNGSITDTPTPADVSGLTSSVQSISCGEYYSCALTAAGGVLCWGDNAFDGLGSSSASSSVPVAVTGLGSGVTQLSSGIDHSCAVLSDGSIQCWGYNEYGDLGDGTTSQSTNPVAVAGLPGPMAAVACGDGHTCALTTGGAVWCWGWNRNGQLGNGSNTDSPAPVPVSGLTSGVSAIVGGGWSSCALTQGGQLYCWGYNENGDLGDGNFTDSSTPVPVP